MPRALVVTGGTQVDIDRVRVLTNRARGRLGVAIGNALQEREVQTVVLAAEDVAGHPELFHPGVQVVSFRTYFDLARELDRLIGDAPPDLVFMPAAISDYAPVPVEGKVRSDMEEITLTLRRLPKILGTLRDRCGEATFIVGFKLLVGVSDEELVATARAQNRSCRIDLTVANDDTVLRRPENVGRHVAFLVPPEGDALALDERKADFAKRLVDFCVGRQARL